MATRLHVVGKIRDQPRLSVAVQGARRSPANLQSAWGQYHRAYVLTGQGVRFDRSDGTVPPYVLYQVTVTADPTDTWPRFGRDWRAHLILLFQRGAAGAEAVYETESMDDGATWSTPTVSFASGKYPVIAVDPETGAVLRAVYRSNTLVGTYQGPADSAPGAEFTFRDANGANLLVEDDAFDVAAAPEGARRWLLVARKQGESLLRDFWSGDDGESWTEL